MVEKNDTQGARKCFHFEFGLIVPVLLKCLLGRRQANLCFHFAGSGENLPDIAKSRDATLDNKLFSP